MSNDNYSAIKVIMIFVILAALSLNINTVIATEIDSIEDGVLIEPGGDFEWSIETSDEPIHVNSDAPDGIDTVDRSTSDESTVIEYVVDDDIESGLYAIEATIYMDENTEEEFAYEIERYYTIIGVNIPDMGFLEDVENEVQTISDDLEQETEDIDGVISNLESEFDEMRNEIETMNDTIERLVNETLYGEDTDEDIGGIGNIIVRSSKYIALIVFIAIGYLAIKKNQEEDYGEPVDFSP